MGKIKNLFKAFSSNLTLWVIESFILNLIDNILFKYNLEGINKKKDLAYIFGSGSSLNDISQDEWESIKKSGDVFSFNDFIKSNFIDIDFHVIREFSGSKLFNPKLKLLSKITNRLNTCINIKEFNEVYQDIITNKRMINTNFIYLKDYKSGGAIFFRWIYGKNLKPTLFYSNLYNRKRSWPPSESYEGIPHGAATLMDMINICYIAGYSKIVLVGVDLYDRKYFFLQSNETRKYDKLIGKNYSDSHETAKHVIDQISKWAQFLNERNKSIWVYNKKSLLNKVIPIYESDSNEKN
jgi:hypothetical protein